MLLYRFSYKFFGIFFLNTGHDNFVIKRKKNYLNTRPARVYRAEITVIYVNLDCDANKVEALIGILEGLAYPPPYYNTHVKKLLKVQVVARRDRGGNIELS